MAADVVRRAERTLGMTFTSPGILERALVHRSYLNENPGFRLGSNERLEYLGDAVVDLIVSDYLFRTFPEEPEGVLSAMRASLVRWQTLAKAARRLNLRPLLLMSKGEAARTGRTAQHLLGQAYEAIIGAIYLDQGYEAARQFVLRGLAPDLDQVQTEFQKFDPKSRLQELTQARFSVAPAYDVVEIPSSGPRPHYSATARLGDEVLGNGVGETKQDAEEAAARVGLQTLHSSPAPRDRE